MVLRALAFASLLFAVSSCGVAVAEAPPCSEVTDPCQCHRMVGCSMVMDGCFCESECGANVVCACGGGKFLRCEDAD